MFPYNHFFCVLEEITRNYNSYTKSQILLKISDSQSENGCDVKLEQQKKYNDVKERLIAIR